MKRLNKKGYLDWFFIIAALFIGFVSVIIAMLIITKVDATGLFADTPAAQGAIDTTKSTILSFDNMGIFIVVGLSIFVLVSSVFIYNHPAFFIVGMFFLSIAIVVAAIASNTFWDFTNLSQISPTTVQFPKITFLMEHLPYYICFMGVAAAIVGYIGYKRA